MNLWKRIKKFQPTVEIFSEGEVAPRSEGTLARSVKVDLRSAVKERQSLSVVVGFRASEQ